MTTEKQDEQNGCLKFSKNTWHYKVVTNVFGKYFFSAKTYRHGSWVNKGFDTSLCEYFWTVILCSFILPFKIIWEHLPVAITNHDTICKGVLLWAFASAGLHYYIIYPVGIELVDVWYFGFVLFFGGIGLTLAGVGVIAAVFKINDIVDDYELKRRRKSKPDGPSKPHLLVEFIKARKNKVCPCIKFVDEEKEDESDGKT